MVLKKEMAERDGGHVENWWGRMKRKKREKLAGADEGARFKYLQ